MPPLAFRGASSAGVATELVAGLGGPAHFWFRVVFRNQPGAYERRNLPDFPGLQGCERDSVYFSLPRHGFYAYPHCHFLHE